MKKTVYTLPKHLDEKVAALHLAKVGAKLTKLTQNRLSTLASMTKGPFQT